SLGGSTHPGAARSYLEDRKWLRQRDRSSRQYSCQAVRHVLINRIDMRRISVNRVGKLITLYIKRFQILLGRHWIEINECLARTVGKVVVADNKVAGECRLKATNRAAAWRRCRADRARPALRIFFALDDHNPSSLRCLASRASAPRAGSAAGNEPIPSVDLPA